MRTRFVFLVFTTLALVSQWPSSALAQSLCGPGFGTTPPGLICVAVDTNQGTTTQIISGPSPLPITTVAGDYQLDLMAIYINTGAGMQVDLAGSVTKLGTDPAATVSVTVEGGRGGPLGASNGTLRLTGQMDGAGQVQLGGAAGFPAAGNDLSFTGFPVVLDATLFGAGQFDQFEDNAGPVAEGSVAVRSLTVFNLVDTGTITDIPTGTGTGTPVFPQDTSTVMVIRIPIDGRLEHFPIEQFFVFTGAECDGLPHFHVRNDLTEAISLEGGVFQDPGDCGAGTTNEIKVQSVAIISSAVTLSSDYIIPPGQGLFVMPNGTLTVAAGVDLMVEADSTLTNFFGSIVVDGRMWVEPTGSVFNDGGRIDNLSNTVENFGTFTNSAAAFLDNRGTFNNRPGGTFDNFGQISNTGTLCNEGSFNQNGQLTGNGITTTCSSLFAINQGMTGAWFDATTPGQGFLFDIEPESEFMFLAWFTYDDSSIKVGAPEHRWLTAQGNYSGASAQIPVFNTSGGRFDDPQTVTTVEDGSLTVTFDDCTSGTIDYDLPSQGLQGQIPITRVIPGTEALCQTLLNPAAKSRMAIKGTSTINQGVGGAWFDQSTPGQGFLFDVEPASEFIFMAWFTYDVASVKVGTAGQRWLTAQGSYSGASAQIPLFLTSGGLFDSNQSVSTVEDGSVTLNLTDCSNATINYSLSSDGLQSQIPIQRVIPGTEALCEMLGAGKSRVR